MKENENNGNEPNLNPFVLNYIRPKNDEDIIVPFQNNYLNL